MSKKKQILFAHQNFPAQYKHLAPALSNRKDIEVSSLAITQRKIPNINNYFYNLSTGNNDGTHRLALEFEAKMIRAESAAKRCLELREDGLEPDIVISHPGWGETLFIKEVWPNTKLLNYFEYYYHTNNSDVDFDNDPEPEFPSLDPERGYTRPKDSKYIITWAKVHTYVRKKGPKRIELTEDEKEIQKTLEASITKEAIDEWGNNEMMRQVRKDYWSHPDAKGLEEKR